MKVSELPYRRGSKRNIAEIQWRGRGNGQQGISHLPAEEWLGGGLSRGAGTTPGLSGIDGDSFCGHGAEDEMEYARL